jgi:hypothetical protein
MKKLFIILFLIGTTASFANEHSIKPKGYGSNVNIESGSTNTKNINRSAGNFEEFLHYFLTSCFWGKNTDSLTYSSAPIIKQFIHKDIGFGRYWNPGTFLYLYRNDNYGYTSNGSVNPKMKNTKYFKEKLPKDGFCEESSSPDGIYYKTVTKFPKYWDPNKEKIAAVKLPKKYINSPKMLVNVLYKKMIVKKFYFAKADGMWWLLFIDDGDCSA